MLKQRSTHRYTAADSSSVVAIELLSPQVFQPPVTAAGTFSSDEGARLSPRVFLPPVAAAAHATTGEGDSRFLPTLTSQLLISAGGLL